MALKKYGVVKGLVVGHLRDADDDHYQIMVRGGAQMFRVAVNVKSSAPNAPSTLLYQTKVSLPDELVAGLKDLKDGYTKLSSTPGGLAIDFLRSGLVNVKSMRPVPPDSPGADNDLKDLLESAVTGAMAEEGSQIFAFGDRWGPETAKDKYFKFAPGNGIHDIHMNQGNDGKYKKDNGVYQDGCIIIFRPENKWRAIFLAFQSQSFDTDDQGNPRAAGGAPAAEGARRKKVPSHSAGPVPGREAGWRKSSRRSKRRG
jgi:uncharacterized protein YukJ